MPIKTQDTSGTGDPWQQVLGSVASRVDSQNFTHWLTPTQFDALRDGVLYVRVPNATFRDWIEANYTAYIRGAIAELSLAVQSVSFVFERDGSTMTAAAGAGQGVVPAGMQAPPIASEASFLDTLSSPLNLKYTFSSYVVGSSNQLAHAGAVRVAADPGHSYNPLFLYGGAGLGKTHLMQAVGHSLRQQFPSWRVVYLSAERFTNEMLQSMMHDKMAGFHQRFRNLEALLVDDVQFLSGKERTQEEFFHTFNALYEREVQIVLSSDRPPKEIDQIEERLRSRFEWGLIADIQAPDLETRQAILMKKAELEKFNLPEKIALFMATNIKSNIRELEGALVRLIAITSLTGEQVNEAMARHVLRDLIESDAKRISIETIQKSVCDHFNIRLQELKAKDNSKRVVLPRQIAMWLARELTQASLPEIARAFGDKHHTTVLHSINKISTLRSTDKDLNRTLNKLLTILE